MAQSQFFRDIHIVAHGENTSCCLYPLLRHHHSAVVQWRVLEEDVLYQPLTQSGVYLFACLNDIVERCDAFNDYQRTHLSAPHTHARTHNRHHAFLVDIALAFAAAEELQQRAKALVSAHIIEELAYLVLKDNDERYNSHTHKIVQYGTEKSHLKHTTHKNPHNEEHYDATEHIERARRLHHSVDVIESKRHRHNVYYVFYSKIKHTF